MNNNDEDTGQFIILDRSGEPNVCTDKKGKTLYFESEEEAYAYGEEHLQYFQVVMLEH